MLASISPVGEEARGGRWPVTAAAYAVGSVAGGVTIGALFGGVGEVLAMVPAWPQVAAGLLAAAGLLGLAADRRRLPTWRRQVDERWLTTYRGWVYGLGFGFQLGGALATTVTASATYVVLVGALATGSWRTGAAIGGVFGLARCLPLLGTAAIRTPEALRGLLRRLDGWSPRVAAATSTTQVVVVAAAAVVLTGRW
jgi:sulfite exporter TauE/SafE